VRCTCAHTCTQQAEDGRVGWAFSDCRFSSQRRTLFEVEGNAHASILRCSLSGVTIEGQVNRCTNAFLLRSLAPPLPVQPVRVLQVSPRHQDDHAQDHTDMEEEEEEEEEEEKEAKEAEKEEEQEAGGGGDAQTFVQVCVPEVSVNCSVVRHSECGLRLMGAAKASLVNCVIEKNILALSLTTASQVPTPLSTAVF